MINKTIKVGDIVMTEDAISSGVVIKINKCDIYVDNNVNINIINYNDIEEVF